MEERWMECVIYPLNSLQEYKYAVVLSLFQGKWLFSRHKQRTTWETQGGHIEPGETPYMAACRELYEESGAEAYTLTPLCDYDVADGTSHAGGMVFLARIEKLGPLPESEMAETALFESLPDQLTYPGITPNLYRYYLKEQAALVKM
jgi:8-oxo-dGTP diphosphatase